jgi:formylglycine-generating enzyme required for sulfatase activity
VDNGISSNPLNTEGEEAPMDGSALGGPGIEFSHDAHVCRGGSYNYHEEVTYTAYRFPVYSFIANDHFGARVVLRSSTVVFNGTE